MKARYFVWILAIVVLYFYLNIFANALIDDAFITFSYVKTFSSSRTWGLFPGYLANTATSPLNILLMSFVSFFVGSEIKASILIALLSFCVIAIALIRISKLLFNTEIFGYLGAVAFIFNPFLISSIGLESIPFAALLVVSIYCYLFKKWNWMAIVLGLLTLTRHDGILVFGLLLIVVPTIKLKLRFAGIYLLIIAPWYIFSWIYLGSLLPDTFFIKMAAYSWENYSFFNGILLYIQRYPIETILSFSFLPLMLLSLQKHARNFSVLPVLFFLGVIHFLAYSVLHVPPFHWYYIFEVTVIIVFGVLCLGLAYQSCPPNSWQKKFVQGIIALYFFIPTLGMLDRLVPNQFAVKEMPVHSNCATHEQYKEAGIWINQNIVEGSIDLSGEIGTLAYYCDCYLLDEFSDRNWTKAFIDEYSARSGIEPIFYQLNFQFFSENPDFPPKNYRLSIGNHNENNIQEWQTFTKWCSQNYLSVSKVSE